MPTIKARMALKNIGTSRTEEQALIKAGYSPSYARSGQIKHTKSWEQLLEQQLPDRLLAKKHKQLLEKTERIVVSDGTKEGSHIEDTGQPHSDVNRALDMAYKLKGRYSSEDGGGNKTLIINIVPEAANRYDITIPSSPKKYHT